MTTKEFTLYEDVYLRLAFIDYNLDIALGMDRDEAIEKGVERLKQMNEHLNLVKGYIDEKNESN